MIEGTCETCIYYHHGQGECRRYPPQAGFITEDGSPMLATFWPEPEPEDSCGEYKRLNLATGTLVVQ